MNLSIRKSILSDYDWYLLQDFLKDRAIDFKVNKIDDMEDELVFEFIIPTYLFVLGQRFQLWKIKNYTNS